jgi:hypothetical protein
MGNALQNFRELAQLEEKEPRVIEMIERFEATQSDLIKNSIQSSLQFMKMVGDIAYLYFPAMLDTAVLALNANSQSNNDVFSLSELEAKTNLDLNKANFKTPNLGGDQNQKPDIPGKDGPSLR